MCTQETSRSPWRSQGGMDAGEAAQTWESIHHASSRAPGSLHSEKHCFRGNLKESWGAELTGWIPSPLPFQSHILCGSLWGRQEKLCSCSWSNFVTTLQGGVQAVAGPNMCVSCHLFYVTISQTFLCHFYIFVVILSSIIDSHLQFISVWSLSRVRPFVTPWTTARQASLSITNSRVYSNSCPLIPWCHPTTSSSIISFSSCLQSFPAPGSFPMS